MKYIIDMPEIKRCVDCDFDSYEDGKHFCSIEQSINLREINTIENIHKDCPLKPLKVKELEWKYDGDEYTAFYGCSIWYSVTRGIYIAKCFDSMRREFETLDEAKEFCQQHYENMIFSAMED